MIHRKSIPIGTLRNNRFRKVRKPLTFNDQDNFSLKNVAKKINDASHKVIEKVFPKVAAKMDTKREDGHVDLKDAIWGSGSALAKGVPIGLAVAAPIVGGGAVKAANAAKAANTVKAATSGLVDAPASGTEPMLGFGIPPSQGGSAISQITDLAKNVTPTQVEKGLQILNSGKGVLSTAQQLIKKNSTDPSMLPKTKALKEAEFKLGLPQQTSSDVKETITDKNYLLYGGVALVFLVVIILVLKK